MNNSNHNNQNSNGVGAWVKFFIGTPKRFAYTAIGVGLVICMINPDILTAAAGAFAVAMSPLLGPVLSILIVFAGIKMIFGGRKH